jgi:phospholipid/cholesterol/gamma-HCH transport system substrate-binding protein
MRRKRHICWSEVRVGLLVIISFALLAVTILYIGSKQGIFAKTYKVKVYMERINGLQTGAPVWLSGFRVGSVQDIRFSKKVELKEIEVTLKIDHRVQDRIRRDSVARIGTLGLLGDKYVSITQGSITEPPVPEGGVIQGASPVDFEQLIANASQAVDDLVETLENTRDISMKINNGNGALGRLVNDPEIIDNVEGLIKESRGLIDEIRNGHGSLARLLNDESLYTGMSRLFWSSDTLASQIRSRKGTLGKLIYDPSLYDNLNGLTERLDTILDQLQNGRGTAGKLMADEALYKDLKALSESTRGLVDDIKEHPERYINIRIF